jgi:beta-galactosidase
MGAALARALFGALLMLLVVAGAAHASPRTSTTLDGPWRFLRADAAGAQATGFDDGAWAAVRLPHTFNADDGEAGGAYYRGPAWYRLAMDLPARADRRRFLEFDGAALVTDVWVNGQHAGRHEGGYARFRFDVTRLLQPGRNTLAVRVDNATQADVAPLGGDFTVFGGLYRRVRLVETAPQHLDLLDHGGPGVEVAVPQASEAGAQLRVRARLRNDAPQAERLGLRLTLRDAAGRVVLRREQALQVPAGEVEAASVNLPVQRPRLWQGVHDPYLYRLTTEVLRAGAVVDAADLRVGIRTVAADPQRGFLLNGKPYPLHGVNYFHAGRPGRGLAVGDAEAEEDFRILQELGVTGVRLVHFQHPPRAYELADELGFVLWTEVPFNAALSDTPAFRANLAQQMRELIRQTGHHASVAVWGVGNEVYRSDETVRAMLGELHALARQEDPLRLTAYAHCCAPDDHPMALQTDLATYNRYWGWYDGALTDIGPWADKLHARLPAKPIGLGEYGAGASVLHQESPPRRPEPGGRWHPEGFQALFHEAYWSQISQRPWLWGSFVWLGFDHASAGRFEGDKAGVNDKGLVTYDRRFRKDAFHFYRAQWSRTPMAHLAGRRHTPRPAGPVDVKAYTNAKSLTLKVNGTPVGTATVQQGIATWPGVPLRAGRHHLEIVADNGATDSITWETVP